MTRTLVVAFVAGPVNVLVVAPALLLWLARPQGRAWVTASPAEPWFWIGAALVLAGVAVAAWTVRLFVAVGKGTPAPWAPPRTLVVRGPHRHVRNPMMLGAFAILLGETLLFLAPPLLAWTALFVLANLVYIPSREEPRLQRRFGDDYRAYKANVPRWIPRLSPWTGEHGG